MHEFAKAAVAGNKAVEVNGSFVCEYPKKTANPEERLRDLGHFYHILAENDIELSANSEARRPKQLVNAEHAREFLISIGLSAAPLWHPGKNLKSGSGSE